MLPFLCGAADWCLILIFFCGFCWVWLCICLPAFSPAFLVAFLTTCLFARLPAHLPTIFLFPLSIFPLFPLFLITSIGSLFNSWHTLLSHCDFLVTVTCIVFPPPHFECDGLSHPLVSSTRLGPINNPYSASFLFSSLAATSYAWYHWLHPYILVSPFSAPKLRSLGLIISHQTIRDAGESKTFSLL